MNFKNLKLITKKTRSDLFKEKQNIIIGITVFLFCLISIGVEFSKYNEKFAKVNEYRQETRENWEHRPGKHPHRMAHYGYLVFRMAHPLNIFDAGLDDYFGNVIFLEAHKQNTANLSEAGSSSVLVRFGTFNSAFILQNIVPLIILFLGFGLVVRERENATLKILSLQGAAGREIIWGKIIGLWQFSLLFIIPLLPFIFTAALLTGTATWMDIALRLLILTPAYMVYLFFVSMLTIVISSISKNSASALISLIGCWLLLTILLPKSIQFLAQNLYPSPSRIAFETTVEEDVLKVGDSHNPNDIHFKKIKDSLLVKYNVKTPEELPFNYSGFIMKEGEKISSNIYISHYNDLQEIYRKQQNLSDVSGFVDPSIAIRNFSMIATGSDYFSYKQFQKQAEDFRFKMAQRLNDLQINNISNIKPNKDGPPVKINQDNWKKFEDFNYQFYPVKDSLRTQWIPLAALLFWLILSVTIIEITGRKLKLI